MVKRIHAKTNRIYFIHNGIEDGCNEEFKPDHLTVMSSGDDITRQELLSMVQEFMVSLGYQFKRNEYLQIVKE
jgi:hypothetical protein